MRTLLSVTVLLAGCVLALWTAILVAGSGMAFRTTLYILNGASEPIQVTPVGTVFRESGDTKHLLPTLALRPFARRSFQRRRYALDPGESVNVHYDTDDIQFSEILIEDAARERYVLVADPDPSRHAYSAPEKSRYEIPPLDTLPPPSPQVAAALGDGPVDWAPIRPWLIEAFLLAVVVGLVRARRRLMGA